MSHNKHDGIVILGHPRSGTTLLRRLINGHPNISCPGETHILSACARFIHSESTAVGVDMGVLAGLSFAGFTESDILSDLREFAFTYLRKMAGERSTPRWAEKTAVDSFFIPEIERIFGDDAYFVGIVRHGLDVGVSCQEFTAATGAYLENFHSYIRRYLQPMEAFAHSWLDVNTQLLEFSQRHKNNCIVVRYEDLIDEPETIMAEIMQFVGEDYSKDMIDSGLTNFDDLGFSDHQSFKRSDISLDSREKWSNIPAHQLSYLAEILNPMLETCGYDKLDQMAKQSLEQARRTYQKSLLVHASKQK